MLAKLAECVFEAACGQTLRTANMLACAEYHGLMRLFSVLTSTSPETKGYGTNVLAGASG